MLQTSIATHCIDVLEAKPKRRGQQRQFWRNQTTQIHECSIGCQACAHRAHIRNAGLKPFGQRVCDDAQDMVDEAHPAPNPANGAGQVDSVAAQRIRCGRQA